MTTTAERLSDAAAALVDVVRADHSDLAGLDLEIAAQARDQVLGCLTVAHRYVFAGLGPTIDLSPTDYLRHPMLGLEEALRRRPATGLPGPSPTDVALSPPAHPAARAWVDAARELDVASVEIARARPDNPSWAWRWSGLAPTRSDGLPPPGSPQVAWGLSADLAALSAGLAAADQMLANALKNAGPEYASARDAVVHSSLTDLQAVAALALRLAEAGPLPTDYHLAAHAVGAAALHPATATDLPPCLSRATDMVNDGPPLTGPQHHGLATDLNRCAQLLARSVPAGSRQALLRLAQVSDQYAAVWATSTLFSVGPGSASPGKQVGAVNAFLVSDATGRHTGRPTVTGPVAARAAAHLPPLATALALNLSRGISEETFLATDRIGGRYLPAARPISGHPDRRRYEQAGDLLLAMATRTRAALAPMDPVLANPALRPARDLLRAALPNTAPGRPAHPALPPPVLRPAPGRGR